MIYEQTELLTNSPIEEAEEYAIHDFEGFGRYKVRKYEGIESVHNVACFIEEQGTLGAELLDYFCDIDEAQKAMEESYCGVYEGVADFVEELTEQTTGDIPEHIVRYIDYKSMAYDMEVGGDIFTIEMGYQEVHIFWSR